MSLAIVTAQLADLLAGGLPLSRCLELAKSHARDRRWRDVLEHVRRAVSGGRSLSEAMSAEPVFPPFYVGVVRTAEESGTLDGAFAELARHLAADDETRERLKRALAYPLAVALLSAFICVFLVAVVLPRFEDFFSELGQALPWPTRCLLWIAAGARPGAALLLGTAFLLVVFRRGLAVRAAARPLVQRARLSLFSDQHAARWARRMASLLRSGFTVPGALRAVRESMRGSPLVPAFARIETAVDEGASLSEALRTPPFPGLVADVAAAGEESATLDVSLDRAAAALQRGADARLSMLIALLEPLLIAAVAGAVGFVALALMLPIFDMSGGVR